MMVNLFLLHVFVHLSLVSLFFSTVVVVVSVLLVYIFHYLPLRSSFGFMIFFF